MTMVIHMSIEQVYQLAINIITVDMNGLKIMQVYINYITQQKIVMIPLIQQNINNILVV